MSSPVSHRRPSRKQRRLRPNLEPLEDRYLLSASLVKDINLNTPSALGGNNAFLTVNGTMYFTADDGVHGAELWKSDGTVAGTVMVKDINTGVTAPTSSGTGDGASSSPADLTVVGNTLYFTADDGANGRQLWKSDGTSAGTVMVTDVTPGSGGFAPSGLTAVNGALFFTAIDSAGTIDLWKSDGTATGTVELQSFYAADQGPVGYALNPSNLTAFNGALYFVAGEYPQPALWRSDGTAAGTVQVTPPPYYPWPASQDWPTDVSDLTVSGGKLFFAGGSTQHGAGLWETDGTAAGTVLVKAIHPDTGGSSPSNLTDANGTLFFTVEDTAHGDELWKSDGTAAGTVLVKQINPGGDGDYLAWQLTNANGTLFFTADDGTHRRALWKSDGTSAGTVMVRDLNPGPTGTFIWSAAVLDGTLYLSAEDGPNSEGLWKSDGTAAGTVLLQDFYDTIGEGEPPLNLTVLGGKLFFTAPDITHGYQLWASDGTAAGTAMVKDLSLATVGSNPQNFTNVNGTLFFVAEGALQGEELWKSDGTAAGTALVKDFNPIAGSPPYPGGLGGPRRSGPGTAYGRGRQALLPGQRWRH